jgi:nanoRNase/pAp phosphatase (c-di-AMP/oligoRNAs hydrolase)
LAEAVAKSSAPIIVIDHHAPHPDTAEKATLSITSEDSPSTCEMVYQIFKQAAIQPTLDEARALFLGIAFDTRHFVLANASTLKAIVELCDFGVNPQETLGLLSLPMDNSERLARIKACQRAKLVKIEEWIIAFSHVSAFQASAARALVDLGAHAAAVAGARDDNVEVSFRCTRDFVKETGIHLGKDLAKPLGELLQNGMGGGHAAAAGANGRGDTKTALKHCLALFKEKLSKIE